VKEADAALVEATADAHVDRIAADMRRREATLCRWVVDEERPSR